MSPLTLVEEYLLAEKQTTGMVPLCLATADEEGFPNARMVDLKAVTDEALLFGTDSRTTKAQEFLHDARVAACLWSRTLGVQIRVRGRIERADEATSDKHFAARTPLAQALAVITPGGGELTDAPGLKAEVVALLAASAGVIARPATWHTFLLIADTIEILKFSDDRFHQRTLYQLEDEEWTSQALVP